MSATHFQGYDDPHVVYRFIGADNQDLYVGCTINFEKRLQAHRRSSTWYPLATIVTCREYPDYPSAMAAELALIRKLLPSFNVVGTPRHSEAVRRTWHSVTPRRIRDRVKAQAIREAAVARERGAQ